MHVEVTKKMETEPVIEKVLLEGENWFKITDSDKLRPFFMNIVSDSNHWMFISSNGGLTAGRKNNEYSLFPYYTDDKITESADITGSKTIIQIKKDGQIRTWEPFSFRNTENFKTRRNLYKNFYGNKLMFEERNEDLGLVFRYEWNSSNLYGFVRKAALENISGETYEITMLDGLQNVLPYGVEPDVQMASSNLVDAYKRSEILLETGMGIYALSAIIVDKAEPSEALKANVVFSLGLNNPSYLASSLQLDAFRRGESVTPEDDIKGERGAYFTVSDFSLAPESAKAWKIIANVNQAHADILELNHNITDNQQFEQQIEDDIQLGSDRLQALVASADGLRYSADPFKDARHFSNVLFNIMRGGIFDNGYMIEKRDFAGYLKNASKSVYQRNADLLDNLDEEFSITELNQKIENLDDADLFRLAKEYLPLKFSRRHGDPSRPWNKFSINTRSEEDGSKILDYEGNWRDIFQNWEALVHSYPKFIESMIFKFLNTSTFDGYNPYRVTKGGFDWETIEPDNPWSYIGYWGDHQIIYLLKFLEFYNEREKGGFDHLFGENKFVYAHVPYLIKPYDEISKNHKDTIEFDYEADEKIRASVAEKGADGSLLASAKEDIHHVNFMEKILATVLAKVSNFIPEAGIWMNTQRPEWNDANNALVGNGVSMVTLYYLRRFLKFFEAVLEDSAVEKVEISAEMKPYFSSVAHVLHAHLDLLGSHIDDGNRKKITDALGKASSDYRTKVYATGFSGDKEIVSMQEVSRFVADTLKFIDHSIEVNRREDKLFHAYNIMSMNDRGISIEHLSEMLEGQVAAVSSGYLSAEEVIQTLDALRQSRLYRKDQNSYMLYPNTDLPRFLEKNNIPEEAIQKSVLLQKLVADGNRQIVLKDRAGNYHFNGNFRNAGDLKKGLENLTDSDYADLAEKDSEIILGIFEQVFNHKAFTGRSGTFYAYEGLGSIYWHMVSKLYLAVGEICQQAFEENQPEAIQSKLAAHFHEVGNGIGVHKSPKFYGAFPTDAYSHTPWHRGAQQPGMTGQVKEDVIASIKEVGVFVEDGALRFTPFMLRGYEFSAKSKVKEFVTVQHNKEELEIPENALSFSCCQVPVIYKKDTRESIIVDFYDGSTEKFDGNQLPKGLSSQVFNREGTIKKITVSVPEQRLI